MPDIRLVARGPARRRARLDRHHPARGLCHRRHPIAALVPAWLWLMLAAVTAIAAWAVEGRRGGRAV